MYKTQTRKKRNFSNGKGKPSRRRNQSRGNNARVDISRFTNEGGTSKAPKEYINEFSFDDFELDAPLLGKIKEKGFTKPSEIQDKSILPALEGKDIVGIAGTGTGKTSAFLVPVIQQILESGFENYALIIAPTRELASQINEEFLSLSRGLKIFSTCIIGGTSIGENIKSLKRKNHVIIGTPGRLQDMAKRRAMTFDKFHVLVLDEFDRMLDMGFSKEIQFINKEMKSKDQTLLFSATLDKTQEALIAEMTNNPIHVKAEQSTQDTNAITQEVKHVKGQDKIQMVKSVIEENPQTKTILFSETKRKADQISILLKQSGITSDSIHGDKSQRAREVALRKFKNGHVQVLVATDVVARGIDVKDVELVINYETPRNYTDYVHRIGRTGRAGKTGRAVTFID